MAAEVAARPVVAEVEAVARHVAVVAAVARHVAEGEDKSAVEEVAAGAVARPSAAVRFLESAVPAMP